MPTSRRGIHKNKPRREAGSGADKVRESAHDAFLACAAANRATANAQGER